MHYILGRFQAISLYSLIFCIINIIFFHSKEYNLLFIMGGAYLAFQTIHYCACKVENYRRKKKGLIYNERKFFEYFFHTLYVSFTLPLMDLSSFLEVILKKHRYNFGSKSRNLWEYIVTVVGFVVDLIIVGIAIIIFA